MKSELSDSRQTKRRKTRTKTTLENSKKKTLREDFKIIHIQTHKMAQPRALRAPHKQKKKRAKNMAQWQWR